MTREEFVEQANEKIMYGSSYDGIAIFSFYKGNMPLFIWREDSIDINSDVHENGIYRPEFTPITEQEFVDVYKKVISKIKSQRYIDML